MECGDREREKKKGIARKPTRMVTTTTITTMTVTATVAAIAAPENGSRHKCTDECATSVFHIEWRLKETSIQ